jgi:hypothetical protein
MPREQNFRRAPQPHDSTEEIESGPSVVAAAAIKFASVFDEELYSD